jgi:hypothetical protein
MTLPNEDSVKRIVSTEWVKQIATALIIACLLAIPALFIMYADMDTLKTKTKVLEERQLSNILAVAKADEKFEAIKELLKEIRDEQKEIRKDVAKKQDKK